MTDFAPEAYTGPAVIRTPTDEVEVEVTLRSIFEPIDGRSRWFGRIAVNEALAAACSSGDKVTISVSGLDAESRISDLDAWGRFRISGLGRAPIPG